MSKKKSESASFTAHIKKTVILEVPLKSRNWAAATSEAEELTRTGPHIAPEAPAVAIDDVTESSLCWISQDDY